jgi:hypothetical protein
MSGLVVDRNWMEVLKKKEFFGKCTLGFLTEINRGLNYAWLFWTVLYTLSQEQKIFLLNTIKTFHTVVYK